MDGPGAIDAAAGEVVVLVGTSKGLFTLTAHADRTVGPDRAVVPGEEIYSAVLDCRGGRRRLLVGATSSHWGPSVYRSDDLGASWVEPEPSTLAFPADTGAAVARVWQLQPAGDAQPDVVYAGVEPAALFRSDDGGGSFRLDEGLWGHPHRSQWNPGGGGLCLHTVLPDPTGGPRLAVAVSAAGFYRTLDGDDVGGGQRRHPGPVPARPDARVRAVRAQGRPPPVRARHPLPPAPLGRLPVRRLRRPVGRGGRRRPALDLRLPGRGRPQPARAPPTSLPLTSDFFRCVPDGRLRVYRTTDGGESWEALADGLPQEDAFLSVLRDGFDGRHRSTPPGCTSAPARARSSPPPTPARPGGSWPATCRRCCA